MTDDSDLRINLNPPARKPAPDAPWRDDALRRQGIASELDALVSDLAGGAEAATIALDGGYGTGKTFILERWVQDMQDRGQIAVYYNAWVNDCDDDPLVSLIETLASNDKTDWSRRTLAAVDEALTGILRKYTGIDAQKAWKAAGSDQQVGLLDAARHRRDSREKLKDILKELVAVATHGEFSGAIVVIDELDRCRPTFAHELMERVKHVVNVPGLVFVFGVNIVALRETVRTVYGNIDAHQYLLRMFTTTLQMPRGIAFSGPSSYGDIDEYLQRLASRYRLREFCNRHPRLSEAFDRALLLIRLAVSGGRFTPRESEHAMWLVAKVAASLRPKEPMGNTLPDVLVPLAIVRVKDPDAYYQTVSMPDNVPALIDSLFDLFDEANLRIPDLRYLDMLEMSLYAVSHHDSPSRRASEPPAYLALRELTKGPRVDLVDDYRLSRRLRLVNEERARALLEMAPPNPTMLFGTLGRLTSRFDVVWPRDQA